MTEGLHQTRGWRGIAATLIALAIALRLLIAPGMMPVATPNGITITLCTAEGAKTVLVDLGDKAPASKAQDPCPYAMLGLTPLLTSAAPFAAPLLAWAGSSHGLFPKLLCPHLGVPAPPPPATGPPFLG